MAKKTSSRLQSALLANLVRAQMEMQGHCIPTKNKSRIAAKITKGTSLSFNAAALKGVPGGHWTKMVTAIETGTQVVDESTAEGQATLERLSHSPQNCYTTKSAVHHFGA